ncbi:PREDICTED: uncharacterized protein LOC106807208 [Priapulus caudatus]|uniref:Annexin n=1 Tax=Priapulus caudatus TaxID=37621 RepID=A0ABM1DYF8_PRICU|nr:PREDICTED: uncharacterized protein LOC106807208 [Priapulus caudatus]
MHVSMYTNVAAGAIAAPTIMPLRNPHLGLPRTKIDTSVYVELRTESPHAKLYFTVDGPKPNPFQLRIGGKEVTHKYVGPFTLRPGKRDVKAIAVSRDGLHESQVVDKTFVVEEVTDGGYDDINDFWMDEGVESVKSNNPYATEYSKARTPVRSKVKDAWSKPFPGSKIEGPINPVNYNGTQVNIFGLPPQPSGQPSISQVTPTGVGFAAYGANPVDFTATYGPYRPTTGYLTEQMLQKLEDVGQGQVEETRQQISGEAGNRTAIGMPTKKLEVSPGSGKWTEQLGHIYLSLMEYASDAEAFRQEIGQPKLGEIVSASLEEDEDVYHLLVTLTKEDPSNREEETTSKISASQDQNIIALSSTPPWKLQKQNRNANTKVGIRQQDKITEQEKTEKEKEPVKPEQNEKEIQLETQGTLRPWREFDAENDSEAMRNALKGLGTNEDTVIQVMGTRSNAQRQSIIKHYKTMFGKSLVKDLDGELSGNLHVTVLALCQRACDYDASLLHKALQGLGTDEATLIEIFCTRTNKEINDIKHSYRTLYNKDLEKDIISDTSGHFKHVLVSLVQGNRDEGVTVNRGLARQDAEALYEAGKLKWGTEESKFNAILVSRSPAQLRATFDEYQKVSKKTLEDDIKSEMSGDLRTAMLAIVRCIRSKPDYFSRRLHTAMKGAGTDDDALIRIVVSRCEIDMTQVAESFQRGYKQTLAQFVREDTSGDYRKLLLLLLGEAVELHPKHIEAIVKPEEKKEEVTQGHASGSLVRPVVQEAVVASENEYWDEPAVQVSGTVKTYSGFSPETDAEVLQKAMKGLGADEQAIVGVYGRRTASQRQIIAQVYKTRYGKDLVKDLKSNLGGNLRHLVIGLSVRRPQFDATELRKAMKGLGTKESVLIEILCTRTNREIEALKKAYESTFERNLEDDIVSESSQHFQRLLVSLVQGNRDENTKVDMAKAREDAQALYVAGEKSWGTDEARFNQILVSRSPAHLRAVFVEYGKLSRKDILKVIRSETSGDLQTGLLTIVKCIRNKPGYFAECLYNSMKGLGTDDNLLIRIIVSRCEVDMVQVKVEFNKKYGKGGLGKWIAGLGTKESVLIEILCTRTNREIEALKKAYESTFERNLEDDIVSESSQHFQRLLVSLVQGNRDENTKVDMAKAREDAQALYVAGEKILGTDEARFNQIWCREVRAHLRAVFVEYGKLSRKDMMKVIRSETSGDFEVYPEQAWLLAECLYNSMKGLGTDDNLLIRIIVSRCEVDMVQVKVEFNQEVMARGWPRQWIADDTHREYQHFWLMLIGEK